MVDFRDDLAAFLAFFRAAPLSYGRVVVDFSRRPCNILNVFLRIAIVFQHWKAFHKCTKPKLWALTGANAVEEQGQHGGWFPSDCPCTSTHKICSLHVIWSYLESTSQIGWEHMSTAPSKIKYISSFTEYYWILHSIRCWIWRSIGIALRADWALKLALT